MDELESLVGKSIFDIDRDIVDALESINIKVAVLEYKYKNCGMRYPIETLKLADIDYGDVISFDDLIDFEKIFIFCILIIKSLIWNFLTSLMIWIILKMIIY